MWTPTLQLSPSGYTNPSEFMTDLDDELLELIEADPDTKKKRKKAKGRSVPNKKRKTEWAPYLGADMPLNYLAGLRIAR